jgi:hypothetical protein
MRDQIEGGRAFVNLTVLESSSIADASARLGEHGFCIRVKSEFIVRHRQAKLSIVILLSRRFKSGPSGLKADSARLHAARPKLGRR